MLIKSDTLVKMLELGCCGCFGLAFLQKAKKVGMPNKGFHNHTSQEHLLSVDVREEDGDGIFNADLTEPGVGDDSEFQSPVKRSEDILLYRIQNGLICREVPVKETYKLIRCEDEYGNKTLNEYVREYKIGSGSYGKVVLYRSTVDERHYAIKAFHKSHLLKRRVAPSETAMSDVLREVLIMKVLNHPNIVNLIEVIDDPTVDHFYMVLEYVEGKLIRDGPGQPVGLEENTARKYLRDIVSGLMYLHAHNVIHGDIKPDNLLITASGIVKIGDFGVSQVFENDVDELRRSPGTPVFTAPECCLGLTYRGRGADTWAVGVTLYWMIFGKYPFLGDTLQDTYDRIVNDPLNLPDDGMNPLLKNLIEGLLRKDPEQRMTLEGVAEHEWFIGEEGPITPYVCWCKGKKELKEVTDSSTTNEQIPPPADIS